MRRVLLELILLGALAASGFDAVDTGGLSVPIGLAMREVLPELA